MTEIYTTIDFPSLGEATSVVVVMVANGLKFKDFFGSDSPLRGWSNDKVVSKHNLNLSYELSQKLPSYNHYPQKCQRKTLLLYNSV